MDKEKLNCIKMNLPKAQNPTGDWVEAGLIAEKSNSITVDWCKQKSIVDLIRAIASSCSPNIRVDQL